MKQLFIALLLSCLIACNDSATGPDHSQDNTDNDDTPARAIDSLGTVDSLRGR